MAFLAWSPLREFEALRREVERAFENLGIDANIGPLGRPRFLPGISGRSHPLLNVSEDKDHVYIEALAPGIDPGTLDISVVRNQLHIAGEKQALSPEIKPDSYHRNERGGGKFTRVITLPVEVDAGKVTAEYKNGMLLITLPKAEAAKPKQITVKVG